MEQNTLKSGSTQLSFKLMDETYAIEILKVREIIGLLEITAVPRTASHIRGVVNLRGKIVPVLDMRAKFGLPPAEARRENCIITVMAEGGKGGLLVGILVDSVSEVLRISADQLEPLPSLGHDMDLDFVRGLAKTQGKVTILLDIDKVIQTQDLGGLQALTRDLAETGARA
jgi:purine-binding chemotaxis protein CheW